MDWNETFDLNENGDFYVHSVECEEERMALPLADTETGRSGVSRRYS